MPHRYQLPRHVTGVFAPTGELRADKNGVVTLADNAPAIEHETLLRAGAVRIRAEAAKSAQEAPPAAKPVKTTSKK